MNSSNTWTVQITCGTGPIESRRFVDKLSDWIRKELEPFCLIEGESIHGEKGAPLSRRFYLQLAHSNRQRLEALGGTYALIERSKHRAKRSRKRWFAAVITHPPRPPAVAAITATEVSFSVCRASGKGGQHVNKTNSAVIATHEPTGLRVRVEAERSQLRNKAKAIALLNNELNSRESNQKKELNKEGRAAHYHLIRGNAKCTFVLDGRGKLQKKT